MPDGAPAGPSGPARIGIIGAGFWSAYFYLPYLRDRDDATCVGVVRRNREALDALQRGFELEVATPDVDELLAAGLDGVIVASAHTAHREHAEAALDAGCHVLIEKPMTLAHADSLALVAAAERAGRTLTVAYGYNHLRMAAWAVDIARRGSLGRITHISGLMSSSLTGLLSGAEGYGVVEVGGYPFEASPDTWADPERGRRLPVRADEPPARPRPGRPRQAPGAGVRAPRPAAERRRRRRLAVGRVRGRRDRHVRRARPHAVGRARPHVAGHGGRARRADPGLRARARHAAPAPRRPARAPGRQPRPGLHRRRPRRRDRAGARRGPLLLRGPGGAADRPLPRPRHARPRTGHAGRGLRRDHGGGAPLGARGPDGRGRGAVRSHDGDDLWAGAAAPAAGPTARPADARLHPPADRRARLRRAAAGDDRARPAGGGRDDARALRARRRVRARARGRRPHAAHRRGRRGRPGGGAAQLQPHAPRAARRDGAARRAGPAGRRRAGGGRAGRGDDAGAGAVGVHRRRRAPGAGPHRVGRRHRAASPPTGGSGCRTVARSSAGTRTTCSTTRS